MAVIPIHKLTGNNSTKKIPPGETFKDGNALMLKVHYLTSRLYSYIRMPAATETFKLSIWPCMGIEMT